MAGTSIGDLLAQAGAAVQKSSEQNSLGGMAASILCGLIRDESLILDGYSQETPSSEHKTIDATFEGLRMSRAVDEMTQVEDFANLRMIGIAPLAREENAGVIGAGQELNSCVFQLQIEDGKKFCDFLKTLQPGEELAKLTETLTRILGDAKSHIYNASFTDPDDTFLTIVQNGASLIAEYERLQIGDKARTRLSILLEYVSKGCLPEYVAIEQKSLLLPPETEGGFGPGQWHKDTTIVLYKKYWDYAICVLEKVAKNPSAKKEFFENLSRNLLDCVENAKKYCGKFAFIPPEKLDQYSQKAVARIPILEDAERRIHALTSE